MQIEVEVGALDAAADVLATVAAALQGTAAEVAAAAALVATASPRRGPVPATADVLAAGCGRHLTGAADRAAQLAGAVRTGSHVYRAVDAAATGARASAPARAVA